MPLYLLTRLPPSNIFSQAAEVNSKKVTNDRKHKSTDTEKANQRKRKFAKTSDDSLVAHQASDMIMESSHRIYHMMFPLITYED